MPLYEFICHACQNVTEKMMKISDPHPIKCNCGAENQMEKIISKTSFVLKGTGWYETDFKGSKGSKESKPTAESNNKTQDNKSAAKSANKTTSSDE